MAYACTLLGLFFHPLPPQPHVLNLAFLLAYIPTPQGCMQDQNSGGPIMMMMIIIIAPLKIKMNGLKVSTLTHAHTKHSKKTRRNRQLGKFHNYFGCIHQKLDASITNCLFARL